METINNAADLFALLKKEQMLERFGLKKVGLFGSLVRGELFNDIDILVEDDVDYSILLKFREALEAQTGYKVDIVSKRFAEPVILYRALKEIQYAVTY